ncbi:MAG: nitroreductase [Rhodothermales bacterium]
MDEQIDQHSDVVAEVIRSRRTIHNFREEPVPSREEILTAIDLARWAPNHHLTEPWRFYLLGDETVEAVSRFNAEIYAERRGEQAGEAKYERWRRIPGWIVVTCRRSDDEVRHLEDYAACCCAIHNLQLYLWSRGIGVKWTTGPVTGTDRFFDLVGIDRAGERLVGLVWYGFAADVPVTRRAPVKEILEVRP